MWGDPGRVGSLQTLPFCCHESLCDQKELDQGRSPPAPRKRACGGRLMHSPLVPFLRGTWRHRPLLAPVGPLVPRLHATAQWSQAVWRHQPSLGTNDRRGALLSTVCSRVGDYFPGLI